MRNLKDSFYRAQSTPIWRFEKLDWLLAGLVFLISFIVYALTMTPEICAGDSGELTTAIYNLGAAHPPGYPLYTMLGKVFTYIPLGSVAFRVNLLSVFFGALTIPFFYLFLVRLMRRGGNPELALRDRLISLGLSLGFAFSSTMWSQAVIAEVYTLNAVFAPMILLTVLIWQEEVHSSIRLNRPSLGERYFLLMALLLGMSFTNHLLLVGYLPPLVFFFIIVTHHFKSGLPQKASDFSKNGLVYSGSLASLAFGLLIAMFSDALHPLVMLALLAIFCGGPALVALFVWFNEMETREKDLASYRVNKILSLIFLGIIFLIAGGLLYAHAWDENLLEASDAAWSLVGILLPLIGLGAVSLFTTSRLPRESKPGSKLVSIAFYLWNAVALVVLFGGAGIREALDFIGNDWGFPVFVILVGILGNLIIAYARASFGRRVGPEDQFAATTGLVFKGALFFILPILLYSTLLIRANAIAKIPDPPLSWGETTDASRVINHFLRKQYPKASMRFSNRMFEIYNGWLRIHVDQFFPLDKYEVEPVFNRELVQDGVTNYIKEPATILENGAWTGKDLLVMLPLFLGLVIIGQIGLFRHNQLWFWLLNAMFFTFNILLLVMLAPRGAARDWFFNEVFFIPSHLIITVWFGFGFKQIFDWIGRKPADQTPELPGEETGESQ